MLFDHLTELNLVHQTFTKIEIDMNEERKVEVEGKQNTKTLSLLAPDQPNCLSSLTSRCILIEFNSNFHLGGQETCCGLKSLRRKKRFADFSSRDLFRDAGMNPVEFIGEDR